VPEPVQVNEFVPEPVMLIWQPFSGFAPAAGRINARVVIGTFDFQLICSPAAVASASADTKDKPLTVAPAESFTTMFRSTNVVAAPA